MAAQIWQPDESTGEGYKACLIGGRDQVLKEILEAQLMAARFQCLYYKSGRP